MPLSAGESSGEYSVAELTRTKLEMEAFLGDESKLATCRALLGDSSAERLAPAQRSTLELLSRCFGCDVQRSDDKVSAIEGILREFFVCLKKRVVYESREARAYEMESVVESRP